MSRASDDSLSSGTEVSGTRVLVVEDDVLVRRMAAAILEGDGHAVTAVETAEEALGLLERGEIDLVLSDLRLPAMGGLDLLGALRRTDASTPVIVMTAFGSIESAVSAMRAGANDYVTKPLDKDTLLHRVRQATHLSRLQSENQRLRGELVSTYSPGRIVAVSEAMRRVVERVEKLARKDVTVLITGESGTGKELVARALHFGGTRVEGPFIAINCGALPEELVEAELFGSSRGAFTGANADRAGKLEAADGGTFFLDEVGELPLTTQPKFLRVLEEQAFERIGESKLRRVDVRVVAATNRDLSALIEEGRFREDLYFRLAVVPVHIPPLRERPEDIAPLATYLLSRFAGDPAPDLSPDALEALRGRSWPGNVRELANLIQRALALHEGGPITAEELVGDSGQTPTGATEEDGGGAVVLPDESTPLDGMIRDLLVQALERSNWNRAAAARLLQVPRHILQYRMDKYGIQPPA